VGSKGSGNGQLDRPHDIAVDSSGNNVYVAEQGNFRIQKFTSDGKFVTKWGTEGSGDNQFQDPHSVVVY
jgi:DNA-binding beta-propeller fold protein YncE